MRKPQILVIGYGEAHCPSDAYKTARVVGAEVARQGAVLVTGGLGGVMRAASEGARNEGGLVVGIVPQSEKEYANPFCDVVIATGIGHARDFITAYSADAVIVVGGGVGTMVEASAAYLQRIPIVSIRGSGGTADKIADSYLDDRRLVKVEGETSPVKAVERAIRSTSLSPRV